MSKLSDYNVGGGGNDYIEVKRMPIKAGYKGNSHRDDRLVMRDGRVYDLESIQKRIIEPGQLEAKKPELDEIERITTAKLCKH